MRELAESLGVADCVDLPGFVPDDELARYLQEASLFAMPSRGEGFGLVYVEAMRFGLPCIAGANDAAQEVVVDGETGRLVDPDDEPKLLETLLWFAEHREQARAMGAAGQDRWRRLYRPSVFQDRFRAILDGFTSGAAAASIPTPPR